MCGTQLEVSCGRVDGALACLIAQQQQEDQRQRQRREQEQEQRRQQQHPITEKRGSENSVIFGSCATLLSILRHGFAFCEGLASHPNEIQDSRVAEIP